MHDIGTLPAVLVQSRHSERSEESQRETLHCVQGDDSGVPVF